MVPLPAIHELTAKIRSGSVAPIDLVDACLKRIDAYEEKVRAWVFIDRESARKQALELGSEIQRGLYRGPLHGIPIGVKDIIDVCEWPTAAGANRWKNAIAREDAECIRLLREAGCIFLGKTVTTAYASFDPPKTRNPWDLTKTPGGSSSGSAAAVACEMCFAALATQTGGSITRPASYCGVVSYKSRWGQSSNQGIVPLASSMDHLGVMTAHVRDLSFFHQVLERSDRIDCDRPEPRTVSNAKSLKLGRIRGLFDDRMDPELRNRFDSWCEAMQASGIELVDFPVPPEFSTILEHHGRTMAVEAATYHRNRINAFPDDYPPRIRSLIEKGLNTSAIEYQLTLLHRQRLFDWLADLESAPIIVTPATAGEAVDSDSTGDPCMNSPWSYLRIPTISIPFAWSSHGLPLSIQFASLTPRTDSQLFDHAIEFESRIDLKRRPLPLD